MKTERIGGSGHQRRVLGSGSRVLASDRGRPQTTVSPNATPPVAWGMSDGIAGAVQPLSPTHPSSPRSSTASPSDRTTTQLVLGVGRDSELVAQLFDERHWPARTPYARG
jgi:hypothetical protein